MRAAADPAGAAVRSIVQMVCSVDIAFKSLIVFGNKNFGISVADSGKACVNRAG